MRQKEMGSRHQDDKKAKVKNGGKKRKSVYARETEPATERDRGWREGQGMTHSKEHFKMTCHNLHNEKMNLIPDDLDSRPTLAIYCVTWASHFL